ncbi:acyl carrier protein 2, mitochondrial [Selaginella moellendorffii]|nr:acyl carrier protein 2, mitochondrial [Selaginella moellendorffii]|eukprot:XP_002960971.2 acyl carrier protein 2, mitochondrial [Selaginella moellendorffii]
MLRRIAARGGSLLRSRAALAPPAPAPSSSIHAQIDAGRGWGLLWRRWMSAPAQDGISEKEALDRVMMIVKAHPKVNPAKLTQSSHFMNDLGLDSLDVVEIVMGFEEEFVLYIPDEVADKLVSVPAAVDFVAKHPKAK